MALIAIVGMPGSGKTEVTAVFEKEGFQRVWFGQITIDILKERGLLRNEDNERPVREELRQKHGMAAYATLNTPRIEQALKKGDVVLDGLYSWEEYLVLKESFSQMVTVAVCAPPAVRQERLVRRTFRPLTPEQCWTRDKSQLENLHTGGPIAMADKVIVNVGGLAEVQAAVRTVIQDVRNTALKA